MAGDERFAAKRAQSAPPKSKSGVDAIVGAVRGCMHPVFEMARARLRGVKRARKILRAPADASTKRRKNMARVRFRLPKSKSIRVIQPFEADSPFIRRWRHFMAGPLCYEVWAFPFRLAFGDTGFHTIVVADMLFDAFFLLDATFKCCTVIAAGTFPGQNEAIRSFSGITGLNFRRSFLLEFPPIIIYYIVTFTVEGGGLLGLSLWWLATAPRVLVKGRQLRAYFADMSNNLQVNARLLESAYNSDCLPMLQPLLSALRSQRSADAGLQVKFALIIVLSSHWVGCVFYWLSRIMSHDENTWVHEFQSLLPLFDKEGSPVTTKFNAFSNLGYDYGMPRNWVDMIYSLLVMAAQVYLSALILGTLLNYLVRNNPAEERHTQTLAALAAHVEEKNIPPELRDRMLRHLNFQHKKNVGREMLWFLSKSLTVRVAYHKFQTTMDKCALEGNAFHGCEQAFLDDCLSRLKVMHFSPGELLIKKGDLPRELYMVVEGALVIMDDDNRVVTVIRADVPDMPPYANIASFMIGVHYHHPLIASLDGECTTLILTKEDCDALFQTFPAERERIRENILATYGLTPKGEDLQLSKEHAAEGDQGEWAEMREQVRYTLKSQLLHTLADFQHAVENDDCDKLLQLISAGVDANLQNYDRRTGLHIACSNGHPKMVETLLNAQADPNLQDRWGRTPLMEAVHYRQKAVIGLLEQHESTVHTELLKDSLLRQTIKGRNEKVRQILEVGGIELNKGNYDGRTALHVACARGHEEVVDQLLRAKADINVKDRFGGTPLKDCVVGHHALLATILRTRGGVLPEGLGTELLCTAAGEGDIQTLKLLFESHEDMNKGDYDSRCALHLAAAEARILAVSFLLTHTADANSEDRWGGRPLDDALRGGTLYHLYCGKLIQSWGGVPGTLKDDEEKLAMLETVSIKDALNLVQRLTALGFDKRCIERIGEQELLTSYESCMQVVPTISTIRTQAEALADCVEETSGCVTTVFHDIVNVLHAMAKRLNPNAGVVRSGSVRDLKKLTRVNLWDKVRYAKDTRLLHSISEGPRSSVRRSRRGFQSAKTGNESPSSLARRANRDESMSLSSRSEQLRIAMDAAVLAEDPAEEEQNTDDFAFHACVNGIESDEEEALHEELDRIEAQAAVMDDQGLTPHKMAANAFLKASTHLMMISESFALLRTLFINARFGGHGVSKHVGDGDKQTDKEKKMPKADGAEDPDEHMVTQFDIIRVMDALHIDVSNDDVDAIVEEAETYSLAHSKPILQEARKGQPAQSAAQKMLARRRSTDKAVDQRHQETKEEKEKLGMQNDTAVPLSAVLAGSQSFRLLVCDMEVNHQLCALLESRLKEVLSEQQMEELEIVEQRVIKEGDLVHPSLDNDGKVFFVVLAGFFMSVHPDASVGPPPATKGKKLPRNLQPFALKKGDMFGGHRVLNANSTQIQREIKATSEGLVLVITGSSLTSIVGTDISMSLRLQALMAEGPMAMQAEDAKQDAPRGLLRGPSLRRKGGAISEAFNRARRPSLEAATRNFGFSRSSSIESLDDTSRSGRRRADRSPESSPRQAALRGFKIPGLETKTAVAVGQIQRRGLAETMAVLEDLWNCLTMGHSFVARPALEVVGRSLGEASSTAFMQIFFSHSRVLEHLLVEDEFWRCWLAFTAEQGLESTEDDADDFNSPRGRLMDGDGDSENDEEEVLVEEPVMQRETLFESLVSRFSPTRSLKKRFFEAAAIDQYEPAFLQITGDLRQPLPIDKVPELLTNVFVDLPFRVSKHNAREFLQAFSASADGVHWSDIRSVLKKRRMTVQEQDYSLFLNTCFDPRSRIHQNWSMVMFVIAIYYLATVPVRVAFLPWDSMLHVLPLATDLPVDIITTMNFVVALNTAYRNRRSAWITSRIRIAKKLPLSMWMSAIPLDWLAWLASANNEVCCFCRLPRMALMIAISRNMGQSRTKGVRSQVERMLSMVMLTVHLCACIWFFLGRSYHKWVPESWAVSWYRVHDSLAHLTYERDAYGWHPNSTVWDQYLFSVHWVAATLTVNGLVGPVIPQNGVELAYCIVLMILNMTLFRWIIGEISSIIMHADVHMVKLREEYSQYRSFIDRNQLPEGLGDEIMAHFHNSLRAMVAQDKLLAALCASLQVDHARFLYREIVGCMEVFQGCSDAFMDALCVVVTEQHFNPEELLFESGNPADDLHLVVSGHIETFMETIDGEVKQGEHGEGSAPGVLGFFFNTKHLHNGRAGKAGNNCLMLKRSQFNTLILLFPSDEPVVAENVITQLRRQSKAISMGYAHSVTMSVNSRMVPTGAASVASRAASAGGMSQKSHHSSKNSKTHGSGAEFLEHIENEQDGGSNKSSVDVEVKEKDRKLAVSTSKKLKALLAARKTRFLHMLHSAAFAGDAQKVEEILSGSTDISINDADVLGRTALHIAAGEGHEAVVAFLIQSGADATIQDKNGNTPLNDAVRHHKDAVCKQLREKFHWLKLKLKDEEAAEMLCKLAVNPESTTEFERLIHNGVNVNAVNIDGRSALMVAACEGNKDVVKLLMDSKADPDLTDKWGKTAMAGAIAEDRREVQEILRNFGVKHGKGEMELTVAMCEIASTNDVKSMRVMVQNGVDPSQGDYDMRTPLHLAASNQCLTVLEFLLAFDPPINVNSIDRFGGTPLEDAYRHNNTAAIEILESMGGLRKDDPSQSKAMATQLQEIQELHKVQRQPKVEQIANQSLEGQAAKALNDVVVPGVTKSTTKFILELTKVLEGFKGVMRAGQRSRNGPLAGPSRKAWGDWNQLLVPGQLQSIRGEGAAAAMHAALNAPSPKHADKADTAAGHEPSIEEEAESEEAAAPPATIGQVLGVSAPPDSDLSALPSPLVAESPPPLAAPDATVAPPPPAAVAASPLGGLASPRALSPAPAAAPAELPDAPQEQPPPQPARAPAPADDSAPPPPEGRTSNLESRFDMVEVVGGNFGAPNLELDGVQGEAARGEQADAEADSARQLPGMAASPRQPAAAAAGTASVESRSRPKPIQIEIPQRERRITRKIPQNQEMDFETLEDGLDKLMDLLKDLKLVVISVHRAIAEEGGDVNEDADDEENADLPMGWMRESKAWLLVSRRYRTSAATLRRQLSCCMHLYKLGRRVIKEVRRLLQRSHVHENQLRARGKRKSVGVNLAAGI